MIEADLHSHTIRSFCGNCTPLEMLFFARQKGLKALALTDHGPALGKKISSTFYERFQNPYEGILLLKGMECNLVSAEGEIDLPKSFVKYMDIVLLGLHFNTPREQGREYYTRALISAIERNPEIDIITHPNEPAYPLDFNALAKVAAKHGVALELNNSKTFFKWAKHEETQQLVRSCLEQGCQMALNGDAHTVTEIGEYGAVKNYMEEINFPPELLVNRTLESTLSFLEKRRANKWNT